MGVGAAEPASVFDRFDAQEWGAQRQGPRSSAQLPCSPSAYRQPRACLRQASRAHSIHLDSHSTLPACPAAALFSAAGNRFSYSKQAVSIRPDSHSTLPPWLLLQATASPTPSKPCPSAWAACAASSRRGARPASPGCWRLRTHKRWARTWAAAALLCAVSLRALPCAVSVWVPRGLLAGAMRAMRFGVLCWC